MIRGGLSWLNQQVCGLLEQFFPPVCPVCLTLKPLDDACFCCPSCAASLTPLPLSRCSCCALPFTAGHGSPHLCADCLRQPPLFTAVHAAGLYDGALKTALQRFKYSGRVDLDRPLGKMLSARIPPLHQSDVVVPVPLHPRRLRQRGYNQALLLARIMACNLQIPLEQAMLERTVDSHSQQGLDARQRALNMRGAFRCRSRVDGASLLLIDDVMTTGATVNACSQALLAAGARAVRVAVVARAPRF